MDSIGDNVMTIICVVVGILIIGCALVPIVDNASTNVIEETTSQEINGYNTPVSQNAADWYGMVSGFVISADGTTTLVNGEEIAHTSAIYIKSNLIGTHVAVVGSSHNIILDSVFTGDESVTLNSGTLTYANGVLTATGADYSHSEPYDRLFVNYEPTLNLADDTKTFFRIVSPCIIGDDQFFVLNGTSYTAESTDLPEGTTMTINDDETATVTTTSSYLFAPYEWTGTITTTETTTADSEYKDLYNMIPVLCILGMAYVLIRRFY